VCLSVRLLAVTVKFTLKSINLETVQYHDVPDCYLFNIMVCHMTFQLLLLYCSSLTFVSVSSYIYKLMSEIKWEGFSAGIFAGFSFIEHMTITTLLLCLPPGFIL